MNQPLITPLGDAALTVRFGDTIDEDLNAAVASHTISISSARLPGVSDVVGSYASLSVHYEPITIGFRELRALLLDILTGAEHDAAPVSAKIHRIPTRYDGEDMDDVASRTGLTRDEIIRIHSSVEYRVWVIGFVPGWAYLGRLDKRLVLPRRESPRTRVPAGSVAIAEEQTGVYPSATPGGWHLIGTTETRMFDSQQSRPSLLSVGDRVKFEPVT